MGKNPGGTQPNILVIDDDSEFTQALRAGLDVHGISTVETGDGKTGLDLARQDRPEAIVLCVELPRMSGYTICSSLKKDLELRAIPVIIISSGANKATFDQHRRLKKSHAQAYLHKPLDISELIEVICSYVQASDPADASSESSAASRPDSSAIPPPPPEADQDDDEISAPASDSEDAVILTSDVERAEEVSAEAEAPEQESDDEDSQQSVSSLDAEKADDAIIDSGQEPSEEQAIESHEASDLPEHDVEFSDLPADDESNANPEDLADSHASLATIPVETALELEEAEESLRTQLGYLESKITELEQEKSEFHIEQGRAASARTLRISSSTRESLALKKERNVIKKDLLESRAIIARRDAELLSWNDREMELESQIIDLHDENDSLLTEKAKLEDVLVGKRADHAHLAGRFEKLNEEHEALGLTHSQVRSMVSTLEFEAEGLRSQLPGESEQARVDELEGELVTAQTNIQELIESVQSKDDEIKAKADETSQEVEVKQALQSELKEAQDDLESTKLEHGELRLALDNAELNREIMESRLDDVHVNLEAITNIRIKALQALQIAQNLLHESAGLFEDPSQSQDLSGDLESED